MWEAAEVPYRDEPEIESGQIVLDKARCWRALNLAMHYNEHSDFYYKHVHGDKCTFQFAWHRTGVEYAMPPHGIHSLHATMCQHDFEGRRIFQHRNMDKWQLDGSNVRIHDFQLEEVCRAFLRELALCWSGKPFCRHGSDPDVVKLVSALVGARCDYHRIGQDRRQIVLSPHGVIGDGADECERNWSIHLAGGRFRLTIIGDEGVTCRLRLDDDGVFRGRWSHHEHMPIEIIPCETSRSAMSKVRGFI